MAKQSKATYKQNTDYKIDTFSTVPAAAHFIETNRRIKNKTLGDWLAHIDSDSLSYIISLFKPLESKMPDGMSLPVCDIISLCLLVKEWEGGGKFKSETAWEDALPLIPRLRRSVLMESLKRKGVLEIEKISILEDNYNVKLLNGEKTDSMLANYMGVFLVEECLCDCEKAETGDEDLFLDFDEDGEF